MAHTRFPAVCLLVVLLSHPVQSFAAAKPEDWAPQQGEKFRATPVDVLGPFALFLTPQGGGRRLLLRQLEEEDCVRFYRDIADTPARAVRWSQTTTTLTKEWLGNVRRLEKDALVSPKFDEMPEPEFLMLLFLSTSGTRSKETVGYFLPEYERVRARFSSQVETLFLGVKHDDAEQSQVARDLQMPWLIEDVRRSDKLRENRRLMFTDPPALMIVSRTGVPIARSNCKTKADIDRAVLEMEALLTLMRPGDKRAWPERQYFYRTVQSASFKTGRADPVLVGHVLDLDALRVAGIKAVNATLAVSADGTVTSASVQPGEGITVEFGNALGQALLQSAMVPAIENGRFVEGTYELRLEP